MLHYQTWTLPLFCTQSEQYALCASKPHNTSYTADNQHIRHWQLLQSQIEHHSCNQQSGYLSLQQLQNDAMTVTRAVVCTIITWLSTVAPQTVAAATFGSGHNDWDAVQHVNPFRVHRKHVYAINTTDGLYNTTNACTVPASASVCYVPQVNTTHVYPQVYDPTTGICYQDIFLLCPCSAPYVLPSTTSPGCTSDPAYQTYTSQPLNANYTTGCPSLPAIDTTPPSQATIDTVCQGTSAPTPTATPTASATATVTSTPTATATTGPSNPPPGTPFTPTHDCSTNCPPGLFLCKTIDVGINVYYPQCYNLSHYVCTNQYLLCPSEEPIACNGGCYSSLPAGCPAQFAPAVADGCAAVVYPVTSGVVPASVTPPAPGTVTYIPPEVTIPGSNVTVSISISPPAAGTDAIVVTATNPLTGQAVQVQVDLNGIPADQIATTPVNTQLTLGSLTDIPASLAAFQAELLQVLEGLLDLPQNTTQVQIQSVYVNGVQLSSSMVHLYQRRRLDGSGTVVANLAFQPATSGNNVPPVYLYGLLEAFIQPNATTGKSLVSGIPLLSQASMSQPVPVTNSTTDSGTTSSSSNNNLALGLGLGLGLGGGICVAAVAGYVVFKRKRASGKKSTLSSAYESNMAVKMQTEVITTHA